MLSTSHPGESKSYIRWRNENIHTSYHFVSKLDLILWCKYAECKVVTVISKFKKDAYQHLFVIVFLIRRNTDQTFDWQPLQYRVIVGMLSTEKHYNVDTIKSLLCFILSQFFFFCQSFLLRVVCFGFLNGVQRWVKNGDFDDGPLTEEWDFSTIWLIKMCRPTGWFSLFIL